MDFYSEMNNHWDWDDPEKQYGPQVVQWYDPDADQWIAVTTNELGHVVPADSHEQLTMKQAMERFNEVTAGSSRPSCRIFPWIQKYPDMPIDFSKPAHTS